MEKQTKKAVLVIGERKLVHGYFIYCIIQFYGKANQLIAILRKPQHNDCVYQ